MTQEERYMGRCIQLARNGICRVSPNPMVGAVIVSGGKIIGEGYHVQCGSAHAEVQAIRSVKDTSLLKEATIYVSLEPCSHYGKTPPCADLIIEKQIPSVVIGCVDPFSKVAGRGIKKLRDAGIKVQVGVLEDACKSLIKKFVTFHSHHRPYIFLKWAESVDGFIDVNRKDGKPTVLSNPLTSMLVHKRRSEVDAIMVGTNTAVLDNPSLTVRNWSGENPVRIVIDRELRLDEKLQLFDEHVHTLVFTAKQRDDTPEVEYITLNFTIATLPQILNALYKRNIQSLLVEGGAKLLQSFIDNALWDEALVEKTAIFLHDGVLAPEMKGWKKRLTEEHFHSKILHYEH